MSANTGEWGELGQKIRRLRELNCLTLTQLAIRAGLTPSDMEAIESGECDVPLSTALNIAEGLGVSPGELLEPNTEHSAAALLAARLSDEAPPKIQQAVLAILREVTAKPDA